METMRNTWDLVLAWCSSNPALAWPLLSALVVAVFKPRTPEAYAKFSAMRPAWFWSRFAAALQLVGALGLDPVKATKVIGKVLTGRSLPPPSIGSGVVLALALICASACTPDARRALLETALDAAACALAHQDLPDEQILKVCAVDAVDAERILRLVGESRRAAATAAVNAEARTGGRPLCPESDAGR
jgi:hypothetical protein